MAIATDEHKAITLSVQAPEKKDGASPLPGWVVKAYYLLPVIIYIPDMIFNYNVYSDGAGIPATGLAAVPEVALWGALSAGIVGMAYFLSYLAPWHWAQGHHFQSILCWIGVFVATGITIWNSMAYRSLHFTAFATDAWASSIIPGLADAHISLTMILVAIAPPFWGLYWALVQPTRHHKAMAADDFEQEKLRLEQQAELATIRAQVSRKKTGNWIGNGVAMFASAREEVKQQFGTPATSVPQAADVGAEVSTEVSITSTPFRPRLLPSEARPDVHMATDDTSPSASAAEQRWREISLQPRVARQTQRATLGARKRTATQ